MSGVVTGLKTAGIRCVALPARAGQQWNQPVVIRLSCPFVALAIRNPSKNWDTEWLGAELIFGKDQITSGNFRPTLVSGGRPPIRVARCIPYGIGSGGQRPTWGAALGTPSAFNGASRNGTTNAPTLIAESGEKVRNRQLSRGTDTPIKLEEGLPCSLCTIQLAWAWLRDLRMVPLCVTE